jgi:integrase/recombinase XerD
VIAALLQVMFMENDEIRRISNEDLIEEFTNFLKRKRKTADTIKGYTSTVRAFARFIDPCPLIEVGEDELNAYLESLIARNLAQTSITRQFICLNAFYKYLEYKEFIDENPIPEFREFNLSSDNGEGGEGQMRRLLTIEEARRLVGSIISIRDQLIVLLLLKTGIRRRELCAIDVNDIDFKQKIIRLKPQKKRSNRIVFIDPEVEELLKIYLKYRPQGGNNGSLATGDALFKNRYGERMQGKAVKRLIKKHAANCGLHAPGETRIEEVITPHCCRHFFSTHLWRAKMPREYVKWLRGDKMKKDAFDHYLHIDPEDVREKYLECVPVLLR